MGRTILNISFIGLVNAAYSMPLAGAVQLKKQITSNLSLMHDAVGLE
jgi:hypothetical protein